MSVDNKTQSPTTSSPTASFEKQEYKDERIENPRVPAAENINALLVNPLVGLTRDELDTQGRQFAKKYSLGHLEDTFAKGAIIAQDPTIFEELPMLSVEDKSALRMEITHKWRQPKDLYYLVIACSMAAAVQGVSASWNELRRV